jgi:hypothetical protein
MNRRQALASRTLMPLLAAAALAAGGAAQAQSFVTDPESGAHVSVASTASRAEVLADLRVYQESGLAAAERAAAETGVDSPALLQARERYAALRHGARYAALVARYAGRA